MKQTPQTLKEARAVLRSARAIVDCGAAYAWTVRPRN